jgi:hypothetical protein
MGVTRMGKAIKQELNYPSVIELAVLAELFGNLFELFEFLSGFNKLEQFEKKSGLAAFVIALIVFLSGDRMD